MLWYVIIYAFLYLHTSIIFVHICESLLLSNFIKKYLPIHQNIKFDYAYHYVF